VIKFVPVKKIVNYLKEVQIELSKVTWPKRDQVIRLTLIVFAISAIVAGYIGGLDYIFTKLIGFIISK